MKLVVLVLFVSACGGGDASADLSRLVDAASVDPATRDLAMPVDLVSPADFAPAGPGTFTGSVRPLFQTYDCFTCHMSNAWDDGAQYDDALLCSTSSSRRAASARRFRTSRRARPIRASSTRR